MRPSKRHGQAFAAPLLCGLGLLAGLTACTEPEPGDGLAKQSAMRPEAAVTVGDLAVGSAWARIFPGMGAVYLTIVNEGDRSDRLLRVESPDARAAEMHESLEQDGVVRMVAHPEGFDIPAGSRLELAPAGKHIMLFGTAGPEQSGPVRLILHFERAGSLEIAATVHGIDEAHP